MSTLKKLRIRNYRCFSDHTIDFDRTSIIVGRNNAGKSTLIEALRLIAIALKRFNSITASSAPIWLDDYAPGPGQRLSLSNLGIWSRTIFHRYGDPPAVIEATFNDDAQLHLYIGSDGDAHSTFVSGDGHAIRRRADIGARRLPRIAILPQTVPLEREEKVLVRDYVRSNLDSHLASRHFRNQLRLLYDDYFDAFKDLVESSWPGVRIDSLQEFAGAQGDRLELLIRDGNFVAEAGWMGHGLQIWLQTIWFVTRSQDTGTIVLDEPDVYMHPDLQRRLVRFLLRQRPGLIVATHSTEILAEVEASNVLVLDRERPRSSFATDMPAVQRIVESLGSAQNLQIARLWRARSLVLVEGEDMKILRRIHDLVLPSKPISIDSMPNWSIGGWNGWANAVGTAKALRNSVHSEIRCYCILDSDYHTEDEIAERHRKSREAGVELHILDQKEIENYLVLPQLIRRVIERGVAPPRAAPTDDEVATKIDELVESMLGEVQDCFADQYLARDRGSGMKAASRRAREKMAQVRTQSRGGWRRVSGKELISKLSGWSAKEFGVSFGIPTLLKHMRRDDVDDELATLVRKISESRSLTA